MTLTNDVVSIGLGAYHKRFTLEEANKVVKILKGISARVNKTIDRLVEDQKFLMKSKASEEIVKEYERKITTALQEYRSKVMKLGGVELSGGFILFTSVNPGYWVWYTPDQECKYTVQAGETLDKIKSLAWSK
jgi:hypothetical protein